MATNPPERAYHLIIPNSQLRQPLDVASISSVNPDASHEIRGEFTESQFAAICDGDIRRFMCREVESPEDYGGWTITVRAEDVIETVRSPLHQCVAALLGVHYPDYGGDQDKLTRGWESLAPDALHFLMGVYDEYFDPMEPTDQQLLELMQEHGIGYDDLAYRPPA